jgi:hypothetical protein
LTVHSTRSAVKHCPISKRKIFPDSRDWALSSQACARKIWDIRAHPIRYCIKTVLDGDWQLQVLLQFASESICVDWWFRLHRPPGDNYVLISIALLSTVLKPLIKKFSLWCSRVISLGGFLHRPLNLQLSKQFG